MDPASTRSAELTPWQRWLARLEAPVDGASVGVFRVVFGLAVAIDAWRYLAYGWVDALYVRPAFHFHYFGFGWVHPVAGDGMRLVFWGISGLALLVAAGVLYRVASVALFVAYAYVFLLDQAAYMNHHYLVLLIALLLACMPAANAFALGRQRLGSPGTESVPTWAVWILRFQLVVVYVYGAIAKLDPDWLRGQPMRATLEGMAAGYPAELVAVGVPLVAYGIAYLGLLADAVIPLCLVFRRSRRLGFAIAVVFHVANAVALNIGIFSYLMIGMLPIFFEPDWPRRLLGTRALPSSPAPRTRPILLAALHVYVVLQLLIPLRHWLYPGAVRWTEEGHRFAWRMMLRTKHTQAMLYVTDPATRSTWTINPANDLTSIQLRELETDPDVLLQYAHFHRDRLRAEGVENPVIQVAASCTLNGRPPQPLVDPAVDLAKVERSLWPAWWILPLRD